MTSSSDTSVSMMIGRAPTLGATAVVDAAAVAGAAGARAPSLDEPHAAATAIDIRITTLEPLRQQPTMIDAPFPDVPHHSFRRTTSTVRLVRIDTNHHGHLKMPSS